MGQGDSIQYRAILCRYNEISLKSDAFQDMILNILIDSMKLICQREKLSLQSALNLKGRLIFFFPTEEINDAIQVFKHIIGIQSISPVITVTRKFNKIKYALLDYASHILKNGDIFTLSFKSIVHYPISDAEARSTLIQEVIDFFSDKGMTVKSRKKNTKIQIGIEIREKGTYIFHKKIPTLWAGFPTETNKALLYNWTGHPYDRLATQLLVRRGSIVTPIIFQDPQQKIPSKLLDSIKDLAKYYPIPIPVILIPFDFEYIELVKKSIPEDGGEFSHCLICMYVQLKIIEEIIIKGQKVKFFRYGERNLHYRGIINPFLLENEKYMRLIQNLSLIVFNPLVGIQDAQKMQLNSLLDSKLSINNSFQQIITQIGTQNNATPDIPMVSENDSYNYLCPLKKKCIIYHTSRPESLQISEESLEDLNILDQCISPQEIGEILEEMEIITVSGKILKK
jgi:tRNA uracil 4-sulfurtransferase